MSRLIPELRRALRVGAAAAFLTTACSPPQRSQEVDIGKAARAASKSVDAYAAAPQAAPPRSTKAPATSPTHPAAPAPSSSDGPDANQAVAVAQRYFTLIGQRQYRAAWALWDRQGAASGMSAEAFAASFAKYRSFRADVGAPSRIDAGAGQRYVTVPVAVTGTLQDGRSVAMEGPVTLHRSGNIDGATAAQRAWRLHDTALKPRPLATPSPSSSPSPAPTIPDQVTAHYRCADGTTFRATFDNVRDLASLVLPSGPVHLSSQRPASGIWYAGDGYDFRGKGDAATLKRPADAPLTCRAVR